MKRWLPEWVSTYKDRHGKPRYRFRRKGYKPYTFKATPGSEDFRKEYDACLKQETVGITVKRAKAGTFDELLARYYVSPAFLNPGARTQVVYRGVLERWRETKTPKGVRYGDLMVVDLTAKHVGIMMSAMLPHRTAANMLRKRLRAIMDFAVREGMAPSNPVISTQSFDIDGDGFHTWTEEEIARYEERHPLGSKARLVFDLLLWTGQRGGDVRVMGVQHVRDKRLFVTQEKTKAIVSLPILPPLAESILAAPKKGMIFILTEHGKPFSRKGFGNWFRDRCDEAGLKHCSAHGLRKAAARRFAEAGCSNQEIKAWTGHTTDSEVSRYTAKASQQLMSDAAAEKLMANLRERLAKPDEQEAEKS